jgi:integrase
MSIYKRGPNRYEVRLYRAGIPKAWIVHGTKRQAENFEAARKLEFEAIGPTEYRTAPGFSNFCLGRYRVYAEARLKAKTWRNRQYQIATLVGFFGQKPLDRITSADVERFQHERLLTVGAVKVNDDTKVLRAILRYAVEQGVPARVPAFRALPERKKSGRVKVWTAAEVEKLYMAIQATSPRLLGMVVVMLNTGLRAGEVLALEWTAVDLDRGLLLIYPNEDWQPKNGEPREVPIGRAALPWLSGPRASKRWVFPASRRAPGAKTISRYVGWPQKAFDRAVKLAGIGGSPHVCRHTFASHFLPAQPDLFLLAKVMGHSHTRVTALYAHLLPDHLERARDAVCFPAPLALADGASRHDPDTLSVSSRGKTGKRRQ